MFPGSRAFRMDCFAVISKTEASSRRKVSRPKRFQKRRGANNEVIPLGVIRFRPRTPLLLIVSEHAGGSWLASVEDSVYRNVARQLVLRQKLALIKLEVSIGTGK